jgi:hypothetical protein
MFREPVPKTAAILLPQASITIVFGHCVSFNQDADNTPP